MRKNKLQTMKKLYQKNRIQVKNNRITNNIWLGRDFYKVNFHVDIKDIDRLTEYLRNPPKPDEELKELMKGGNSEISS